MVQSLDAAAQQAVLAQLKAGTLPAAFKRTLLITLANGFHKLLDDEFECFICLQEIDLAPAEPRARYLLCCDGTFICEDCLHNGGHQPHDRHALRAELFPVLQAKIVRRELGLSERR